MRLSIMSLLVAMAPCLAMADDLLHRAVDEHILPGFGRLAAQSAALEAVCAQDCSHENEELRSAYHEAFDAWVLVSHLRFGFVVARNSGDALAFWPDPHDEAFKMLAHLMRTEDPAIASPEGFAGLPPSIRGLFALEVLLYDETLPDAEVYRRQLTAAVIRDIAITATEIEAAWRDDHAEALATAGSPGNDAFPSAQDGRQALLAALTGGLRETADIRLGQPLGTFEQPRPARAEARRSGRSRRHVRLSLEATRDLASLLAEGATPEVVADIELGFASAIKDTQDLDDPVFAGVATPAGRIRIEALQQRVTELRSMIAVRLGKHLGVPPESEDQGDD